MAKFVECLPSDRSNGMSILMLDGPLRGIDTPTAQHFGKRLLDMVERGLS